MQLLRIMVVVEKVNDLSFFHSFFRSFFIFFFLFSDVFFIFVCVVLLVRQEIGQGNRARSPVFPVRCKKMLSFYCLLHGLLRRKLDPTLHHSSSLPLSLSILLCLSSYFPVSPPPFSISFLTSFSRWISSFFLYLSLLYLIPFISLYFCHTLSFPFSLSSLSISTLCVFPQLSFLFPFPCLFSPFS